MGKKRPSEEPSYSLFAHREGNRLPARTPLDVNYPRLHDSWSQQHRGQRDGVKGWGAGGHDEETYPSSSPTLLHFQPQKSISLTRKYQLVCNYEVTPPTAVRHSQQDPTPAIIYSLLFFHEKYTVIRY